MSEICRSYKYTEQPEEEGFIVFSSPEGDKIRFKIDSDGTIVEVVTQKKQTSIKKALANAGFKKTKEGYERGHILLGKKTICTVSRSKLIFFKSFCKIKQQ